MTRHPIALAILALAATAHGTTDLSVQVQNTLTAIDVVPTSSEIDADFGDHGTALADLSAIAMDPAATAGDADPIGIRIRALHALSTYCTAPCDGSDAAHAALSQFIQDNQSAVDGQTLVMLRAAIEAIGVQRVGTDVGLLESLLAHPSRDIRAATAHALRDLCNTTALGPLRAQESLETSDQVRLAISEALRVLSQPSPCP